MGTRSTITFTENEEKLCKIYQQYDGYLDGVGKDLAEFLQSGKLVNGITMGESDKVFNGAGCLVAQFISENKTSAGGLYVIPLNSEDEEYNYIVNVKTNNDFLNFKGGILISCDQLGYGKFYTPEKFLEKIED